MDIEINVSSFYTLKESCRMTQMTLNQVKIIESRSPVKVTNIEIMAGLEKQMTMVIWVIFSVSTKTRWNC